LGKERREGRRKKKKKGESPTPSNPILIVSEKMIKGDRERKFFLSLFLKFFSRFWRREGGGRRLFLYFQPASAAKGDLGEKSREGGEGKKGLTSVVLCI